MDKEDVWQIVCDVAESHGISISCVDAGSFFDVLDTLFSLISF